MIILQPLPIKNIISQSKNKYIDPPNNSTNPQINIGFLRQPKCPESSKLYQEKGKKVVKKAHKIIRIELAINNNILINPYFVGSFALDQIVN